MLASALIFLEYCLTEINTIPICLLQGKKRVSKLQSITALKYCCPSGETKLASGANSGATPFGKDLPGKGVEGEDCPTKRLPCSKGGKRVFLGEQETHFSRRGTDFHTKCTPKNQLLSNTHKFLPFKQELRKRHH